MSRLGDWWNRNFATVQEAAPAKAAPAVPAVPTTVPRRGYEYGIPAQGLTEINAQASGSGADNRQSIMRDLYDAFLACPWAWTATNAISRTITGGGLQFDWDPDDGDGDKEAPDKPLQVLQCERLLRFCNPREDITQLLRSTIADLEVFGDAFIEVVWAGGIPVALYTLDCPSTTPIADTHGNVTGYVQLTEQGQRAAFEPHEVIHISLDAPRSGIFGVSPTYAALLPMKVWLFTMATLKEIFRKGLPPNLHVDHPGSMSPTEQGKWTDQYMTRNVGPLNIGRPVVTKGGATVKELQQNRIDEILHVLDQQRDAILAAFGVPPAEAGVIESGNLGGGTGEAQHKMFLVNTCQPIAALVLEKLNFVLLSAFGIDGWALKFGDVDMRDSKIIEDIRDQRIRSGLWTLNRARAEIGEPPIEGGNEAILIDRQNLVLWRDLETYSNAGIAAKLRGTALEPDEPKDGQKLALAKPEPKPIPPALARFAGADPSAEGDEADAEDTGKGPQAPPDGPAKEVAPLRRTRQMRESWAVYSARIRQAMEELPHERDHAA